MPRHPTRKWKKRLRKNIRRIVVHTSASDNQDPIRTAKYHITPGAQNHLSKEGAPGFAYHDSVVKSGTVFHCNDYQDITWHAGAYNRGSIGVVLAFRGQDGDSPTLDQYSSLISHLSYLCLYLHILPKKVIGHREVPGMFVILGKGARRYKKTCPGMAIDLNKMRRDLTLHLQRRLAAEGLYDGAIDGLFGKKSRAALRSFKPPQV